MTESFAGVETTEPRVTLPVLHPDPHPRDAVKRLQHMFNEIDRDAGRRPRFNETGEYGTKTITRVRELQEEEGLEQTGSVGSDTWRAVLERWLLWPER